MDKANSKKWRGIDACVVSVLGRLSEKAQGFIPFTDIVSGVKGMYRPLKRRMPTDLEIHNVLVRMKRKGILQFNCHECAGRGVRVLKNLGKF